MSAVNLKTIISKQVPNFVQEDHQGLQQFLEAYYEYVNQNVKEDIGSLRDLDKTLDEFVVHIKNELDVFGEAEYPYIDKILFLRKIKQVLLAKGSEAAYRFLFKVLFDKPISITYPWDVVLKASDGKWNRDISVFVKITEGNPTVGVEGSRVAIVGSDKTIYVYVDNVRFIEKYVENGNEVGIYEFFIEKSYYGTIQVGNKIEINNIKGTILPTTSGYEIINPGRGYKIGDVINGTTFSNNKTINQRLKVTRVNLNGGIVELKTLNFGYDYQSSFFLYTSSDEVIRKSRISLTKNGSLQFDIPDNTQIERYQDYGQVTTPDYWSSILKTVTVSSSAINATTETITAIDHKFATGDGVKFTTTSAIGGLSANSNYYVIKVNDNTFKLALTDANAQSGTAINLTNTGTGNHTFTVDVFSNPAYAGTLLEQFFTESISDSSVSENFTLIRFDIGPLAKYQGYYYSNDGFLSDGIYLQDSKYYQKYSYLITVDERLQDYKTLLKSFIHPAGVALFGEYQIQNVFKSSLNLTSSVILENVVTKATIVTINKTITETPITISDIGGYIDLNPYDGETHNNRPPLPQDRYNEGDFDEFDNENPTLITILPS
jgi:hypothetical protein